MSTELKLAITSYSPRSRSIHRILRALWLVEWMPTDDEHSRHDPTMVFLALYHLQSDGEWAQPKSVTNSLAQFCWGIKLVSVVETVTTSESKVEYPHILRRLQPFYTEKRYTTFSALRSLQHYATALALKTINLPQIWWTDYRTFQELMYLGRPISIRQIKVVFHTLEARLIKMWREDILLGLECDLSFDVLQDVLNNTSNTYCLIDEPANGLAKHRAALMAHLFDPSSPHYDKFVDSRLRELRRPRAMQWMSQLAKFEGLLMLYIDMTSGAPPRGTELVMMMMRNSDTRIRNCMGLGMFLSFLRMYDKTTQMLSSDKLIPHSLGAVATELVLGLHSVVRPVASFLASKLEPGKPNLPQQYASMMFMDHMRPFTSQKLTTLMEQQTEDIVGWPVHIAGWRHIIIAFKRRLCQGSSASHIMDEIHALQSGHSVEIENSVYGLDAEAMVDADPLRLAQFLEASTEVQTIFGICPGGLGLGIKSGTMDHFDELVARGVIVRHRSATAAPTPPPLSLLPVAPVVTVDNSALLTKISRMENTIQKLLDLAEERRPSEFSCSLPFQDDRF